MAFPTIPTVAAGRVLTAVQANNTATRTFPSLSSLTKNSGDLLIAIVIGYQSSLTSAIFSSWGGGFTEFHDSGGSSQMCVGMAYKWSDGTEIGTFSVTQGGTVTGHAALILLSIPGAHATTPPEANSRAVGTTAAADPAAFDAAGWAAEDTLWIAVGGSGETSTTGSYTGIASAPTNYTDYAETGISADVVGGVEGAAAFRQLNASSEDVGVFSVDLSNARNVAVVVAVRPAPSTIIADVPAGLVDFLGVVPQTGKIMGLSPVAWEMLGMEPPVAKTAAIQSMLVRFGDGGGGVVEALTQLGGMLYPSRRMRRANVGVATIAATVDTGLVDFVTVPPVTVKAAGLTPGLLDLQGTPPATAKAALLDAVGVGFVGVLPSITKLAPLPQSLVRFVAPALIESGLADVSVGLVDFLGPAPTTAKVAGVGVGLVDFVGAAPTTLMTTVLASVAIDFVAITPAIPIVAAAGPGMVDFFGIAPVVPAAALVSPGVVELAGTPPGTAKAAPVGFGRVVFVGVPLETDGLASLNPGFVDFLSQTPNTAKATSVDAGVVELHGLAPTTVKAFAVGAGLVDFATGGVTPQKTAVLDAVRIAFVGLVPATDKVAAVPPASVVFVAVVPDVLGALKIFVSVLGVQDVTAVGIMGVVEISALGVTSISVLGVDDE